MISIARTHRRALRILLQAGLLLAATSAHAAVTVNKTFSPSSMTVNGTSTLTITLGNTGAAPATGTALTDNLPSGVVVASPSNVATTCGGTASATPGGSTVSLSGGTIPANGGSCTVTAAVTASALGNYENTIPIGGVTSSEGSNGSAATATLAVIAAQPVTVTFGFTWPPGTGGRLKGHGGPLTTTMTFNNPNTLALTNVGTTFSLIQPALGFATPDNLSTTCGGTVTLDTTARTGTLAGGTIPANGNCRIVFNVAAVLPNEYYFANTNIQIPAGNITSDQGITNSTLVNASIATQTGARVDKTFAPAQIISGGTSTLTLTFHNLNVSPLTPIDLIDALPSVALGAMTVAPTPNASTTCGGAVTAVPGAGSVELSGGSLPAVAANANGSVTCTVTVDVIGTNTGTTAINLTNTIPVGNFAGVGYPAEATNLNVLPNEPLFGSRKVISNYYYAGTLLTYAGARHTLTITLNNTTTSPITVTSLTDDLTTMGTGFTVAIEPPPSTTCAGGTVTAPVGGTTITMTGGTIPASDGTTAGSCTVTVGVHFALAASSIGNHTNTIAAGDIVTSAGDNTTPITYRVAVVTPLALGKSFSPAAVNPGATSTLTININYAQAAGGVAVDPLTNVSATDTLPAGLVIATPSGLSHTCTGATVTAPAGGSTIAFSGVNVSPGNNCAITLNVFVPPDTPPGTYQNVIPANSATTDQGVTNSSRPIGGGSWRDGSATANLIVGDANVTINKSFTPANVAVGGVSQLAIQFVNTNPGAVTLTQAALTDELPAGMVIASPPGASFNSAGCAGTINAPAGGTTLGLSNAQINAGATCTLRVNVVSDAAGNLINTVPAGALASLQNVTNLAPTTATLAVSGTADLGITKTNDATEVVAGTTTTYSIVVSNAGPHNVAGAVVTDTPDGMTFTSWTCIASANASCGEPSGSGPINDTINIDVGATVTYTVQALIDADYGDASIANTATITQPPLVTDPTPGNNDAVDTDTVLINPQITIVKLPTALDGTVFPYTSTAPAPDDAFDLSSATTLTRIFAVTPGTVSVTEGTVAGWSLTGIECVNDAGSATFTYTGATQSPTNGFERGDGTANVTLNYGDAVTCTYTNAPTTLPTLAKYFNTDPASMPPPAQPPAIPRGGTALLTFVINNMQPTSSGSSSLGFTDTLPPGLVLAAGGAPPSALVGTNTCGGTVTAQAGAATITLAGGTVAINAECSFTVRVTTAP